jgi:predicted MFS family arabinose efflux permease
MRLRPYRRILALPGIRPLMAVALLARIPIIAAGLVLTLHVVLDLHRGYGAAGLVGAVNTIGVALGAPALGRLVDRRGLRAALLLTTGATALFWPVATLLPYAALLVAAFASGLVTIPVFSLVRQSIAALVPEADRRPAYALDSMSVEVSYMAGPALAVLVATQVSARVAMLGVGAATVLAAAGLFALNPPTRDAGEPAGAGTGVRRRDWLRPRFVALLLVAAASTVILGGSDVAMVAVLRSAGQLPWTSLVTICWGAYSMIGGFVYGSARRAPPPALLLVLLGLLTVPVGLAGGWWALCLALVPAGLLCAPTLAATVDEVSRLVPAAARGEAMGLYGSAMTVGLAVGAPLAGGVIDATGPRWGFAVAGLLGVAVAAVALPALRGGAAQTTGATATTSPTEVSVTTRG